MRNCAWLAAALFLCSCNPFRRSKPATPPPPPPPRPVSQPTQTTSETIPPPPALELPPTLPPAVEPDQLPRPPAPAPGKKRRPSRKSAPAAAPQEPPAAPRQVDQAPQLRPVLTPEEQKQLNQVIDARLARARAALARGYRDAATARQVATFIAQSEEARKTDLLRAAALAERAALLAEQLR